MSFHSQCHIMGHYGRHFLPSVSIRKPRTSYNISDNLFSVSCVSRRFWPGQCCTLGDTLYVSIGYPNKGCRSCLDFWIFFKIITRISRSNPGLLFSRHCSDTSPACIRSIRTYLKMQDFRVIRGLQSSNKIRH